jgi:hypothetical protein
MTEEIETAFIAPAHRRRLQARMTAIGGQHLLPVIDLLRLGVALLILPAGKFRYDTPKRATWCALIGDDFVTAEGPSAFHIRSMRKLLDKASAVFIMCGRPVHEAYAAAADIAAAGANVVIIETQAEEEASWANFVRKHAPKLALTIPKPPRRKAA